MSLVRDLYQLTKPGIIKGNLLPAVAGYFLAVVRFDFSLVTLLVLVSGLALVIAAACVVNNILDRDIDAKMDRTKTRALVTSSVRISWATVYASILLFVGMTLLYAFTTHVAALWALAGFLLYVGLYTPAKRKTYFSTELGSLSGAVPPVVGYTAVTGSFDQAALLLFLFLVLWQMPHFYAIALFRGDEYRTANVPLLPLVKGQAVTVLRIKLYAVMLVAVTAAFSPLGITGWVFLLVMIAGLSGWLRIIFRKYNDVQIWARQVFIWSLYVLLLFSVMISIGGHLP